MRVLHDHLDHWAGQRPDGEFAVHGDRVITWREAGERTDRLANALVGLGLPVGARIAVLAKNCLEYLLLYYAASKAGVVPVPLNFRSAPPEWVHVITDARAALVVADAGHIAAVNALRGALGARRFVTLDGASVAGWDSLPGLAAAAPATPPERTVDPDDDLYQLYTRSTRWRTSRSATRRWCRRSSRCASPLPGPLAAASPLCE